MYNELRNKETALSRQEDMMMRTEFVVVVKHPGTNKKDGVLRYGARKWAEEAYNRYASYPDTIVEMYKEHYIGNSFHDRERLA